MKTLRHLLPMRLMAVLAAMSLSVWAYSAQVFLDVPDEYNVDNPTWKVWSWADGQNGDWVNGTVLSNGLIEFTVNDNNLQFVRMSPDGNTVWNRSENQTVMADAKYTIAGWGNNNLEINVLPPPESNSIS